MQAQQRAAPEHAGDGSHPSTRLTRRLDLSAASSKLRTDGTKRYVALRTHINSEGCAHLTAERSKMSSDRAASTIDSTCRQLCACFDRLCDDLNRPQGRPQGEDDSGISLDDVNDLYERFRLWTGNLGALQPPQDKRSLEHRLRNEPQILRRTQALLQELHGTLQQSTDELCRFTLPNWLTHVYSHRHT